MKRDIMEYGADPNGIRNCAGAIQKAIDEVYLSGGGMVVIPPGSYLSGSFVLKSRVDLHLDEGSRIVCSLKKEDISPLHSGEEAIGKDTLWDSGVFISALHAHDVTISGEGEIDGQGCQVFFDDGADGGAGECPLATKGFRPRLTLFEDVERLTIKGITIRDAAYWTVHMAGCRSVLIDSIRILNNERGPNTDGIDPDCCRDVLISNSTIVTADDAVAVKATKPMALLYGGTENIVIRSCVLQSHDSALKIGTETSAPIRHVLFSDCVIKECSRAVGVWVRDGSVVEDVDVSSLVGTLRCYHDATIGRLSRWWGVGEPFFISATRRKGGMSLPGVIRNVRFRSCDLRCESCVFIAGEADAVIRDVFLSDCAFTFGQTGSVLPGFFDEQPSSRDVYPHPIPQLYARFVDGLSLKNVSFRYGRTDYPYGKEIETEECQDVSIS